MPPTYSFISCQPTNHQPEYENKTKTKIEDKHIVQSVQSSEISKQLCQEERRGGGDDDHKDMNVKKKIKKRKL